MSLTLTKALIAILLSGGLWAVGAYMGYQYKAGKVAKQEIVAIKTEETKLQAAKAASQRQAAGTEEKIRVIYQTKTVDDCGAHDAPAAVLDGLHYAGSGT